MHNITLDNQTSELMNLMDDVLIEARRQGAQDAAVSVNHDCGFSVDVRMGVVETVAFSEDRGVSITVYLGKQKGSASSSDTAKKSLQEMVTAAIEIAKVSAADPCFGLPEQEFVSNNYPNLDLLHPWDISPKEAIHLAKQCEEHALNLDERIKNSDGVNCSTYTFSVGMATTQGFHGCVHSSKHSMSALLIAHADDKMQRDYEFTTARHSSDLMSVENLAHKAVENTVKRLGAKKIRTQTCPILFTPRVANTLFSSFIQAISGSNLYRKNSFLLDSIGKEIFPTNIQIYEQPHRLRGLGSAPFDDEGIITRPNVFVRDGVVSQYVLGSYSARKLGLATTANSGGVFNLTIDATPAHKHSQLEDLVKEMHTGLIVTELMGQGINIITGDYSRGASGFWVENGIIQYPVEEVTIAGNLHEIFKRIVAVGADINPNIATRCGSVLIENMVVAGKN